MRLPDSQPRPEPPIVLEHLARTLDGQRVLDDVTLTVPAGRITVLMGPSGAGKTVTIKHIVGLLVPDAGDVLLEGRSVPHMTDDELRMARLRCGVLFQGSTLSECGLFGNDTILENVAVALRAHGRHWREADAEAADWLSQVGLAAYAHRQPFELSAGMRKRAGLARALALEPSILILDDFESGLDGVRLNLLCELLRRVQAERRCTVLVTTHSLDLARKLADVVAVLNRGRIVLEGTAGDLLSSAREDSLTAAFAPA